MDISSEMMNLSLLRGAGQLDRGCTVMMNGQNSMPYHKELTSVSTKLVIATKLMQVKEESGVFYFYFLFVWF